MDKGTGVKKLKGCLGRELGGRKKEEGSKESEKYFVHLCWSARSLILPDKKQIGWKRTEAFASKVSV